MTATTKNSDLAAKLHQHNQGQKRILKWWLGFTSFGGLAQFNASDVTVSKAAWFALFLVGGVATVWNVERVVKDYQSRPVSSVLYFLESGNQE